MWELELEINILTRLLTDISLMQSHVSIEQCTIGTDVAAHELHPIISYWLLCSAAIVTPVYKPYSFLI